jgi:hypothetical protein
MMRGLLSMLVLGAVAAGCSASSNGRNLTMASQGAEDSGLPLTQDSGSTVTQDSGAPTMTDSGTTPNNDGGTDEGSAPTGANTVPMVVNAGPAGTESVDVPFISVSICEPGTNNCQTIDYVSVDTGSSGFRVISSVLTGGLTLPADTVGGSPLAECYTYADGYVWGSVKLADLKIGGEVASNVPIHLIGDPAFASVPSDCASTGESEDTVADFGGNAIIGINQLVADCGDACATTAQPTTYYTCSNGANCTAAAVPVAQQVPNPVPSFPKDNNGVVLEFPSVPAAGAATLTGSLVFGIGTESNNGLGSAGVIPVDDDGNFTTVFNGTTLSTSFIDSGSNSYAFNDSSIPTCSDMTYFFCPTSTQTFTAQNMGTGGGGMSSVSFTVANADSLFMANGSYAAFNNIGGPWGLDNTTFDWGFPFFMGRSVFVGFAEGGAMPNGYFAY